MFGNQWINPVKKLLDVKRKQAQDLRTSLTDYKTAMETLIHTMVRATNVRSEGAVSLFLFHLVIV